MKLGAYLCTIIAVFIVWFLLSSILFAGTDTYWSIYRLEQISLDVVVTQLSWFKISVFAIVSAIIGLVGVKSSANRR